MDKKKAIIAILLAIIFIMSHQCGENNPKPEIRPYINYIEEHQNDPVDYMMQLFEDHDLVIFCER